MEKYDFIKLMLKSRNLSVNDKKRLVLLATQEIEKKENKSEEPKNSLEEEKHLIKGQIHAPKDTAAFLSLFNHEDGFKFLTHDFIPNSEIEYDKLVKTAREMFFYVTSKDNDNRLIIPTSLYALIRTIIIGGDNSTWMDSNGKKQTENFACSKWIQWAKANPNIHVLSNVSILKVLMAFRSTIRLVLSSAESDSRLETIIKRQEIKHADLSITSEHLEKADFYTYVCYLEKGIKLILDDMSKYSKESPKVKISFDYFFNGDYKLCVIKITQYGSFSSKSLEEVQNKFNGGGGDFYSIKNTLCGYCNWSVETKWGNEVKRWNILDDSDKGNVEDVTSPDIPGFTHILTYYYKMK